jgi:hypothetical protein
VTVHFEIPYVQYTGNGATTVFTFDWTQIDPEDMYVELDGVEQIEGIHYELENFKTGYGPDDDGGGEIVYADPVASGAQLLIKRETPVRQELDYLETTPFQAETHEMQMDKDTLILQEIINAGAATGEGPINLASVEYPTYVEITNTGGENAIIPTWNCDDQLAGVFAGEVTETAPSDGDPDTHADGYMYLEIIV